MTDEPPSTEDNPFAAPEQMHEMFPMAPAAWGWRRQILRWLVLLDAGLCGLVAVLIWLLPSGSTAIWISDGLEGPTTWYIDAGWARVLLIGLALRCPGWIGLLLGNVVGARFGRWAYLLAVLAALALGVLPQAPPAGAVIHLERVTWILAGLILALAWLPRETRC